MTLNRPNQPPDLEALLAHSGWVRKLARAMARGHEFAEDCEQEAWRIALERPPKHGSNLKAWWTRVVHSATLQRQRSETRHRHKVQALAAQSGAANQPGAGSLPGAAAEPGPDDIAERMETFQLLARLVNELPEPFGSTVFLHYFEGLSTAAIGKRQGVPKATVQSRLRRGVARLRARMHHLHGEDWRTRCLALSLPASSLSLTASTLTALVGNAQSHILPLMAVAATLGGLILWQPWNADVEREGATLDGLDLTPAADLAATVPIADGFDQRVAIPPTFVGRAADERVDGAAAQDVDRDAWIEIEVLDAQGNPWPDQLLRISARPANAVAEADYFTNSEGLLRIPCIAQECTYFLSSPIEDGGNGIQARKYLNLLPGEFHRLTLAFPKSASIAGRVLDSNGRPMAGALIHYQRPSIFGQASHLKESTTTDAQGSFHFDGFEGGFRIKALPPSMPALTVKGHVNTELRADNLVVQYPRCRLVQLTLENEQGEPLVGVEVERPFGAESGTIDSRTLNFTRQELGRTDASGQIVVPAPWDQSWPLSLGHADFGHFLLDLPAGISEYTARIPLGASLGGHVYGPDGQPLPGAKVLAWGDEESETQDPLFRRPRTRHPEPHRPESFSPWSLTTSNADGSFQLDHLPVTQNGFLMVEADGLALHGEWPIPFPSAGNPIEIHLQPSLSISGRLLDHTNRPLPEYSIVLAGQEFPTAPADTTSPQNLPYFAGTHRLRSDEQGRFAFHHLEAGLWTVRALSHGRSEIRAEVKVQAGTTDLVVRLGDGIDQINVLGTVVDQNTQLPIPGFEAVLAHIKEFEGYDWVGFSSGVFPFGDRGEFRATGMPVQPYVVQIDAPGYAQSRVVLEAIPGNYDLVIPMVPAVRGVLQLKDSAGSAVDGIRLEVYDASHQRMVTKEDDSSISYLELGGWNLTDIGSTTDAEGKLTVGALPIAGGTFRVGGEDGKPSLEIPFTLNAGDGDQVMVVTLPDDFLRDWRRGGN